MPIFRMGNCFSSGIKVSPLTKCRFATRLIKNELWQQHVIENDKVRVLTNNVFLFQIITFEHDCILSRILDVSTTVLESFMA